MTNISATSVGVKLIHEPANSTQNKEPARPDVFELLLTKLSRSIQEGLSTHGGGENIGPQGTGVKYGLPGNLIVRDEDALLSVLPTSDEHADSFFEVGILGHQQKTFSEESKHVGIVAESAPSIHSRGTC